MRSFVAVADAGSLGAGGRVLALAQPTLSRQMDRPESALR
ncbi:MAG TPA: LysR family transcriptional regulator [Gemmatimonadales bacterium]